MDATTLIQIAVGTPRHLRERGLSAEFIRVSPELGLKFYVDQTERDTTFDLQNEAASFGLAPHVGNKVEFTIGNTEYYGYTTEVARVAINEFKEEFGWTDEDIDDYKNEQCNEDYTAYSWRIENSDEYKNLIKALRDAAMNPNDMHIGNVGWMPDGRMVCIDFDCFD